MSSINEVYNKSRQLKTSAEIIKEARMSLNMTVGRGAKMVGATRRPETPAYPARSFLLGRLKLNHPNRRGSAASYCSENSVESEPPSRFQRLDPLPQRPHSASASIEKGSARIKRRPLSVITTSVTCDTALHQLQKEKRNEQKPISKTLSNQNESQSKTNQDEISVASLPISNSVESGYYSRLSSANNEDEISSITSDDLNDSKNIPQALVEQLQTCLNKLNPLARSSNVSEEELGHWVDKLSVLVKSEPKLAKRGQLRTIILQTLFRVLDETMPQLCAKIMPLILSLPPDDIRRSDVLIQLLSTVRNLLDSGRPVRQQMLEVNLIENIVKSMDIYASDSELILHGSRILSKISLHEDCCEQLVIQEADIFKSSVKWLKLQNGNQLERVLNSEQNGLIGIFLALFVELADGNQKDVTVRILFVLGNLLSQSDKAQWHLFQAQGFVQTLVKIFETYLAEHEKLLQIDAEEIDEETKNGLIDLLVKLIRVVANLSVHQAVGSMLCLNEELILCHVKVLQTFLISEKEELVLNTLVSVHNLSFYQVQESAVQKYQLEIVKALYPILISEKYNPRKAIESFNVLGNLTQHKEVCEWLIEHKIHTMMIVLLDGNSAELACSACGILINLSLQIQDSICVTFSREVTKKAVQVLQKYKNKNWYLCALICKLLCNILYSPKILQELNNGLIEDLAKELLETTEESTEKFAEGLPIDLSNQLQELWEEEFCPVATKLLEILSSNNENIEQDAV